MTPGRALSSGLALAASALKSAVAARVLSSARPVEDDDEIDVDAVED
jgi:hypothetical protein